MVTVIKAKRRSPVLTPSGLACLSVMPTINLTVGCLHDCVYYAIFLWAREELDNGKVPVKEISPGYKHREHSNVLQTLKRSRLRHRFACERFRSLYDLRCKSDYTLDETVGPSDVSQALDYAQYLERVFRTAPFNFS